MTALDLFDTSQRAAMIDAQQNLATDLPVGFGEALSASWDAMTTFHSSINYAAAKEEALGAYSDDVYKKTGMRPDVLALSSNPLHTINDVNKSLQPIIDAHPDAGLSLLSDDDVDRMALDRMRQARERSEDVGRREKTFGGSAGSFVGTLGGGLADPVVAATLPLGGAGELGVLGRALEFGAIGAGTEGTIAAFGGAARDRAVPGSSAEIPGEILSAGAGGLVLGGAFGMLGRWLKASDGPLLTTAREDANAAASEAQLTASNVFPTAAGEAANRDAVTQAVAQVARGDKVATSAFDVTHVDGLAAAAEAKTAEDVAVAAEQTLRPETHAEVPEFGKTPPEPPSATDAAFDYWDQRLVEASPEERAAMGAADERPGVPKNFDEIEHSLQQTQQDGFGADLKGEPVISKVDRVRDYGPTETMGKKTVSIDGQVVASADVIQSKTTGDVTIQKIETIPSQRRNGYAKMLVDDLFDEFPSAAVRTSAQTTEGRALFNNFRNENLTIARREPAAARDISPEARAELAASPEVAAAQAHDLDHVLQANPDMDYVEEVHLPDGTVQLQSRKLSDVLAELGEQEAAAKELEACVVGLGVAAG